MSEKKEFTREEILTTIADILNDHQGEDFKDITEETIISEKYPEMDDLDRVEVIMEMETAFDIVIEDDEAMETKTNEDDISFNYKMKAVKEWIDFIQNKITSKAKNG